MRQRQGYLPHPIEGFTGTWSPATINTTTPGTSPYTFTPTAGQCANPVSINITIVANVTPTFAGVPTSICQNATAPLLPATSDEAINGTWSPATINTSALGTTLYTFTPTAGQCANPFSVNITIVANVTPTFAGVPTSICQNATAPLLPATSDEAINGTWSPATINTSALGTTLYTFTPTAGQCANPFSVSITIVANVTPTFAGVPTSICQNATAPLLPATSDEAINGTWSPATIVPYFVKETPGPLLRKFLASIPREKQNIVDFIVALNQRLHQEIRYLVRMDPGVQTSEETLSLASGSCRDTAWLLVHVLRHIGLASRFVSGYLIQLKPDLAALDGPPGTASTSPIFMHGARSIFPAPAGSASTRLPACFPARAMCRWRQHHISAMPRPSPAWRASPMSSSASRCGSTASPSIRA